MPLGNTPIVDKLILTAGADFTHRVTAAAGDEIPLGTTAEIRLYDSLNTAATPLDTWAATTVTGGYVEWIVQSTDADAIPDRSYFRLYVTYDETPTLEHCWYRGTVSRKQ